MLDWIPNINVPSQLEPYLESQYLIGALAICLIFVFYNLFKLIYPKFDPNLAEIKDGLSRPPIIRFKKLKELSKKTDEKFTKYKYMFIQAGDPGLLKRIGMTGENFQKYRLIVSVVILLLYIGNPREGVLYVAGWYGILTYFLKGKKRKRHNEIKLHLSKMIDLTIDYLKSGLSIDELIKALSIELPSGTLKEEIIILNLSIQSNVTSLNNAIGEFKLRIDMEEIDNFANALLTYESTGKAIALLKRQHKMSKIVKANATARQTKGKGKYMNLATVMMIVGIIVVALSPFAVSIMNNPIFR